MLSYKTGYGFIKLLNKNSILNNYNNWKQIYTASHQLQAKIINILHHLQHKI